MEVPFDMIVVQPFTATDDPTVLGIKPVPNLTQKIEDLLAKYRKETMDIDDIEFETVDVEDGIVYIPADKDDKNNGKEDRNGIR